MDPVVTARVPEGIRSRGVDVLHEIGSTTSELINAAFNYVISERKLPTPSEKALSKGKRTLSSEQKRQIASFMDSLKVDVPAQWNDAPFETLLDQAMEERYAHLR